MLMVGYIAKLGNKRGFVTRRDNRLKVRNFLPSGLVESTLGHFFLSVIRKRLPGEVFVFSLSVVRKDGLLPGRKLDIVSSAVKADASMEPLMSRQNGISSTRSNTMDFDGGGIVFSGGSSRTRA